jgi:hypothetical protein
VSFLYRVAIAITRRQPYVDWANSFDDGGPQLGKRGRRRFGQHPIQNPTCLTCYRPKELWQQIFEAELPGWRTQEDDWPAPLTREMFDAWFSAELTDSVFDLTPEEPLTQADVDLEELADAASHCAWCDLELDEDAGRVVVFKLPDRDQFAHRAGLTLPLVIDDERVVVGIMSLEDSDEAKAGGDVLFRACTSRCEKGIRKAVPKALRKMPQAV